MQSKDKVGAAPKQLVYRKTSAEIVSEARNSLLAAGSVKLVSTRRPITPNVNKRQLYVDVGPAGRPPSAFNLKYLQHEARGLPCLEPISQDKNEDLELTRSVARSGSLGTIYESLSKTKLPALHEPPRISTAGSLENCEYDKTSTHFDEIITRYLHFILQNLNYIEGAFSQIDKGNEC
jgi:hypothetical protein